MKILLSYIGNNDCYPNDFLDYICTIGNKCQIYYLWRPYLKDIKDDFVLELAFNSESDFIITYNKKDFKKIEKFGINVFNPKEFSEIIEVRVTFALSQWITFMLLL